MKPIWTCLLMAIVLFSSNLPGLEAAQSERPSKPRLLKADTPSTTVAGNTFIAPAGWSIYVKGPATIVEAPEGDSRIVLVDVNAKDSESAIAEAWAAYRPDAKWPLKSKTPTPDEDGWEDQQTYVYLHPRMNGATLWREPCGTASNGQSGFMIFLKRSVRNAWLR